MYLLHMQIDSSGGRLVWLRHHEYVHGHAYSHGLQFIVSPTGYIQSF